ncbi:MAG TPA: hypothetical protein VMX75_06560 [Spirochaetia bacterium]|nr:hypothetical protein [Spirochaetia bacterium]
MFFSQLYGTVTLLTARQALIKAFARERSEIVAAFDKQKLYEALTLGEEESIYALTPLVIHERDSGKRV